MTRDSTHMEQVERWAEFVKNNPREKWKPRVNAIINSQFEIAQRFYERLGKTEKGREILERLRKEKTKVFIDG